MPKTVNKLDYHLIRAKTEFRDREKYIQMFTVASKSKDFIVLKQQVQQFLTTFTALIKQSQKVNLFLRSFNTRAHQFGLACRYLS